MEIKTRLLRLVEVIRANADVLFEEVQRALQEFNLDIQDCTGLGTDGASVMVGVRSSVYTRIKEKASEAVKFPCICHSLALCVQQAFETLPCNLATMLKDIPGWFAHSAVRRNDFKKISDIMTDVNEYHAPLPFKHPSTTRWLVRGKVIFNILMNWWELLAYFQAAEQACAHSARYKARVLVEMLADDTNRLYFTFLCPLVSEFERVNASFQAENADAEQLASELEQHHRYRILRNITVFLIQIILFVILKF